MSQTQTVSHVVPNASSRRAFLSPLALPAPNRGGCRVLAHTIPLIIAAALLVSGCGRKDEPAPPAPPTPVSQQGAATTPGTATDRPAPDTAKAPVADYPKPGQVNNHSSPEFDSGGKATK